MQQQTIPMALTFDDVLLVPGASEVLPSEVSLKTRLTQNISLQSPLLSAAMDTVTEHKTAIAMAREGGIGIIHKNMSIDQQAKEVERVKKSESGMIADPITVSPYQSVAEVQQIMRTYRISGLPVIEDDKLVGIVTNRDLRFVSDDGLRVNDVMTSKNLVTAPVGIDLPHCKALLHEHRIEKLLIVDDKTGKLKGLITIKDIEKIKQYPYAAKDSFGRLLAGAALGVGADLMPRAEALIKAKVDVVVLDSAHGHSAGILRALQELKSSFPELSVIAGNIATAEATEALIKSGASAVKVGVGPGSICTTRIVAGVGVPQLTALKGCVEAAAKHGIPVIADGGIKFSGDVCKALGIGADAVMIGSLFAGTDETPGETFLYQGRKYKGYRGMGSIGAMREGSGDRYFQDSQSSKLVPEGIEGKVPYRGPISEMIYQLLGGLRSGMGYVGAATIEELHEKARFVQISTAGLRESHVHDVIITKEAPNYRTEGL
nr:IMP dehydrogenase [uncultured Desulfobulbus sp.]